MNRAHLKKYDTGRAQRSRHRQKADRLLLECGVSECLANQTPNSNGGPAPVVGSVLAPRRNGPAASAPTKQMLLWDQPVHVATRPVSAVATPSASGAPGASDAPAVAGCTGSAGASPSPAAATPAGASPSPTAVATTIAQPSASVTAAEPSGRASAGPSTLTVRTQRIPLPLGRQDQAAERFTLWGFLRGCGIGLAAGVAILLIHVLIR